MNNLRLLLRPSVIAVLSCLGIATLLLVGPVLWRLVVVVDSLQEYSGNGKKFVISGQVLDQNGNPVPGAFLSVTESNPTLVGKSDDKLSCIDNVSAFVVKSEGYYSVMLSASKPGYKANPEHFTKSGNFSGVQIVMTKE